MRYIVLGLVIVILISSGATVRLWLPRLLLLFNFVGRNSEVLQGLESLVQIIIWTVGGIVGVFLFVAKAPWGTARRVFDKLISYVIRLRTGKRELRNFSVSLDKQVEIGVNLEKEIRESRRMDSLREIRLGFLKWDAYNRNLIRKYSIFITDGMAYPQSQSWESSDATNTYSFQSGVSQLHEQIELRLLYLKTHQYLLIMR